MIAAHKGEVPFAVYILPFMAGIISGIYFPQVPGLYLLWPFILLSLCFVLLNIFFNRLKIYNCKWLGGVLIHLLLVLSGWIIIVQNDARKKEDYFSRQKPQYLLIRINNEPRQNGNYVHFAAQAELGVTGKHQSKVSGSLIVTVRADSTRHFNYGDEVLIPARITEVDPPFNPGEFNYKQYLAHQQILHQAFLTAKECALIRRHTGNPLIDYSLKLRQQLVDKLKANMHSPEAIAVASTLILGYKADLSPDVIRAYSSTGTIHVLSVSGAHVAIIFVFINFALSFLNRYRQARIIKILISIILIWFYAMLTGFSPAVCRAAVMISMIITGKAFDRYINALNILALSAFILLLCNPLLITDVGFQLSYLAVLGLVIFQPVVYHLFEFKWRWTNKLWYFVSASIAAQTITFPLSAFYFHQFPVYFLISNLFIIIPSEIIMLAGIVYLALPQIPVVSKLLGYLLEQAILLMDKGLTVIEHAPYASLNQIWIPAADCLIISAAAILLFHFFYSKKQLSLKLSLTCILLVCLDVSYRKINLINIDSITFLNVKKHIGVLFKKGDEAVLITDLKPDDKTFIYSIRPGLDSNGVIRLKCIAPADNFKNTWFYKAAGLIQFKNNRIILLNKSLVNVPSNNDFKADYLFMCENAPLKLAGDKNHHFKTIIINGDNYESVAQNIKNQTVGRQINFVSLKRNKALVLSSN